VPTSSNPQPSRGNFKFLLLGLAFLGGAAILWVVASRQKPPEPPPSPPPADVQRVNPLAQPDLELEEKPDAGQPQPEPTAVKKAPSGHKVNEWDCSGDLPNALKVINDNRAQIRSCYERRLKINNVLQGDLRLKLKVGANGRVEATAVAGSIHDEDVFACVRNLAGTWTFPVPSGGACAVVQVPFQFSPKAP
jgi:outer membrane biosynthesis protein TonB